MIDVTQDIHSLTTFKRNSSGLMKHMKKTGRPLVLTVKGKAEAVVLDAKAYQEVASQLTLNRQLRASYSGIFPCFLLGFLSRLVSSISSA